MFDFLGFKKKKHLNINENDYHLYIEYIDKRVLEINNLIKDSMEYRASLRRSIAASLDEEISLCNERKLLDKLFNELKDRMNGVKNE